MVDHAPQKPRSFEITDESGELQVRFGHLENAGPVIEIFRSGKVSAVLTVADNNPTITLVDRAGGIRGRFVRHPDETTMTLFGEHGTPILAYSPPGPPAATRRNPPQVVTIVRSSHQGRTRRGLPRFATYLAPRTERTMTPEGKPA